MGTPRQSTCYLAFSRSRRTFSYSRTCRGHTQSHKKIKPFLLLLHNIRFFPSPTAPRAIAADIIPTAELFELAYYLEEVARSLGFSPETKPYLPHLTLGRIVHHHTSNIREELKLNASAMLVDKIVLFDSKKTEYNQIYTSLASIPFQTATATV